MTAAKKQRGGFLATQSPAVESCGANPFPTARLGPRLCPRAPTTNSLSVFTDTTKTHSQKTCIRFSSPYQRRVSQSPAAPPPQPQPPAAAAAACAALPQQGRISALVGLCRMLESRRRRDFPISFREMDATCGGGGVCRIRAIRCCEASPHCASPPANQLILGAPG